MKTLLKAFYGSLVLSALVLSGCGKADNGGGQTVVNGPGIANCVTCSGYGQQLVTATSTDQLGEALTLQFFTQGASAAAGYGQTYTGYNNSTYQVAAQGVLYITQASALSCGMPPGQYQVSSNAPSMMYGSAVSNLQLIAQGPNQAQLLLNVYFLSPTQMQVRGYMQGAGGQACQLVMN